ncbi:hypothetical protein ACVWZK_008670 [Bradyrhizobium sp. GM0.4]
MALATQPDASAILRDAAPVRGYHVAEPADVSSEQYLGSFACVIEAIVSVIKVWSSLHVHSGIRKMCVVFDSDAAVFQCTLVCRENDIPKPRQWRFTEPRKFCLILYAISLASAWVAAIESRGRHDIANESPSRQQKAYRQPCYCEARKPDLQVQIYQFARCGLPRATTTFHIRKIGCLSNIAHTRQMYRGGRAGASRFAFHCGERHPQSLPALPLDFRPTCPRPGSWRSRPYRRGRRRDGCG